VDGLSSRWIKRQIHLPVRQGGISCQLVNTADRECQPVAARTQTDANSALQPGGLNANRHHNRIKVSSSGRQKLSTDSFINLL